MSARYLGFVLLVWFPGMLCVQSTGQPCPAPSLNNGYFLPPYETYEHEKELIYACNDGQKPTAEGWWATSICQNGKWSPEPQCIDTNACTPPTIPNSKYIESQNGWFENQHVIRIKCDEGYVHKNSYATAKCVNGTWSSLPLCQQDTNACGEPPKIPHAVVTQGHKKVFAQDSIVQYECEAGYAIEGTNNRKNITCVYGTWTGGPTCSCQEHGRQNGICG